MKRLTRAMAEVAGKDEVLMSYELTPIGCGASARDAAKSRRGTGAFVRRLADAPHLGRRERALDVAERRTRMPVMLHHPNGDKPTRDAHAVVLSARWAWSCVASHRDKSHPPARRCATNVRKCGVRAGVVGWRVI